MTLEEKITRRELLSRGWTLTKVGLLVPSLAPIVLASCGKHKKPYVPPVVPPTYNIAGNISDIVTDSAVDNAEVQLKQGASLIASAYTLPDGSYAFNNISPADYDFVILHSSYVDYEAGKLVVSDQKNLEGKLTNINLQIIPTSFNMTFFNEVARNYGAIQKFADSNNIKFYVYLGDGVTYLNPTVAERDQAISVIENDVPILRSDIVATIANGKLIVDDGSTVPLPGLANGWITFCWTSSGGVHIETLNGNEILRAYADVVPGDNIGVYREEIGQACSGIRCDSDSDPPNTIFNELVANSVTDFTSLLDCPTGKIIRLRPIGNIAPDRNPTGYIINS